MSFELQTFEFETIYLDKQGRIAKRSSLFAESLVTKLTPDTSLEMVRIPAGNFLMGASFEKAKHRQNETPAHSVNIESFLLGKFTVTQAQWLAIMSDLPLMPTEFRSENLPVVNVWLEKAFEFCARLSKMTGLSFRLPSEAEWEYACRAGTTTPFHFGQAISTEFANYNANHLDRGLNLDEFRQNTTPAGFFKVANNFGLFDMHGNVWEWCSDIWHADYNGAPTDGSSWVNNGDQSYCVQRGGSWCDRANACRSAFRVGDIAHNSDNVVGLRICLTNAE